MKSIHKKIVGIIATMSLVSIMMGTSSYAVNTTQNTNTNSNTKSSNSTNSSTKSNQSNQKSTQNSQDKYEGEGLSSLKVEELELSPAFDTKTYEYTVKYIGEETKLQIDITPTEAYYNVEIIGNSDLQEGENLITILVSDQDETNVATYQLNVNKSLVDEEEVAKQKEAQKKQELMVKVAGGLSAGIIVLLIIIGIVKAIKHRKERWDEEEYEDDYEDEEELPRALRKNNKEKGRRYKD